MTIRPREFEDPAKIVERLSRAECGRCSRMRYAIRGNEARETCSIGKDWKPRCGAFRGKAAMTLDDRLENWGKVVRSSKFQKGSCAMWARWYAVLRGPIPDDEDRSAPPRLLTVGELDGWEVERAWRTIPSVTAKWLLKYHYVWKCSPQQLQIEMFKRHQFRLRRHHLPRLLEDAKALLLRELVKGSAKMIIKKASSGTCEPLEHLL